MGGGVSSLNLQLRKELDLYASLVNCFNLPGLPTRHHNVDIVVIRENTEGEYAGLEHEVVPGVVESLKVITKFCSERIVKYAFEYAYLNNRKMLTAVHKASIMKLADGLLLESCREVATKYPISKTQKLKINSWKLEVKIERMRSNVEEKPMKRMSAVHRKADERRAAAQLQHSVQIKKSSNFIPDQIK